MSTLTPSSPVSSDQTTLHIEGMTCGACVARVDKALRSVPGVQDAAVNLTTGMATIQGHPDQATLLSAVQSAGYSAKVLAGASSQALREISQQTLRHQEETRRRLIYGLLFGIPAMAIELMLHFQYFFAIHLNADFHSGYNILAAVLATLVMGVTGWPFFSGAWRALRHFGANMDVLVALGAGTAYLASAISLVAWLMGDSADKGMGGMHLQPAISEFHAAVSIVVLVTLGKYLESRAKNRAASAVAGLATQVAPTATRILPDGSSESVSAEQIVPGDLLQVLAHQAIPVDGKLVEGSGMVDLSILTGETVPVELERDAALPGGAMLADGRIVLRATATAAESTISRIVSLVNAAQAGKTQIQSLADRVAGVFVPVVILLAIGNFAGWILLGQPWERALIATIATVVIACPCAMGLATPTAITVAIGTAARRGILFTNAAAFETARRINVILFDKTGTLTQGTPRVADVLPMPESGLSTGKLLQLAGSMEQYSEHPLAQAIVKAAVEQRVTLLEPAEFHSVPGGGIRAVVGGEWGSDGGGKEYVVGSLGFMESLGIPVPAGVGVLGGSGGTLVLVGEVESRELLGIITLRDVLRKDAGETLQILHARGLEIGVVSGDAEVVVRGTLVGFPVDFVRGNVRPEQKALIIQELRERKVRRQERKPKPQIAFVGDGINDAPALAAADLGIALASASELAKGAGDVLLTSNRLLNIPFTLELAGRTLRIIKQNLFWAFAYNVAAIPLAMLGILPPGVAAGAMMVSSLTVVGNVLRLYESRRQN